MRLAAFVALRLVSSALGLAESLPGSDPQPEERKHLLLDSRVIERTEGVTLKLGVAVKSAANPLFGEDRPWEVRFDNLYPNVIFDAKERLYRCWYSPFIVDEAVTETPAVERLRVRYRPRLREMGVCYAESRDGLHWDKPPLGLVEFHGDARNNLVMWGPHGAGVFFDPTDADPARRYKMLCHASDQPNAMGVAFSPDGLHWSALTLCPEIEVPGDTHNNAFWSPEARKYLGITRLKTDQRLVARTESADFVHWTKAVEILRGNKLLQPYAMPVFRYAGVYLGLLMMFDTASDRVSCELAWSADALDWERIEPGRALIPNSEKRGEYDWGCVYAAASPVRVEKEIRLYYGASNAPHTGWRDGFLALATLRGDGFAGYETTTAAAGFITTKPMICTGGRLQLSADAAHGRVRVAVLGEEKMGFDQCRPMTADVTDGAVEWTDAPDLNRFRGQPIRFRFELTDAKLYAFGFAD